MSDNTIAPVVETIVVEALPAIKRSPGRPTKSGEMRSAGKSISLPIKTWEALYAAASAQGITLSGLIAKLTDPSKL